MSKKVKPDTVEKLDPVPVDDNTTTKSDRKRGANLVEQTEIIESEENESQSKNAVFGRVINSLCPSFDKNAKFNELAKSYILDGREIPFLELQKQVNEFAKAFNENRNELITAKEFFAKLENLQEFDQIKTVCGVVEFNPDNYTENNGKSVKIYHSTQRDAKSELDPHKVVTLSVGGWSKTIFVESAPATLYNFIRSIRYYNIYQETVCAMWDQYKAQLLREIETTFITGVKSGVKAGELATAANNAMQKLIDAKQNEK